MAGRLRACTACRRYTLQESCPGCGARSVSPHPMRFSPEDRFGSYRRRLKRLVEREGGGA